MNNILIKNNVEILKKNIEITSINIFNTEIKNYEILNQTKYSLKAKINGKYVSIKTDNIEDEKKYLELLTEQAKIIDNDDESYFASESINDTIIRAENELDIKKIIEFIKNLYTLKKDFLEIYSINTTFTEEKELINLDNINVSSSDKIRKYSIFFEIIMKKNNKSIDSFVQLIGTSFSLENAKEKLIKEIKSMQNRFNINKCENNKYNILITNTEFASILNAFNNMYFAKDINNKISPLTDKFNTNIFGKNVNIIEEPTNNNYVGKRLFDSEGSLTYDKKIIENGKFITKLYDNQTAKKDNTKSTGNAHGVRNLYLKPSNLSYEELEKKLNEGIIITTFQGLHSGINTKTGSISLQAKGYYIKDNKKINIESMILGSTIFELLNNIVEIGNDLEFINSSNGSPSVIIKDILINCE